MLNYGALTLLTRIKISGIYKNVKVINSPARTYSVSNPAPLTMTDLEIDNCAHLHAV